MVYDTTLEQKRIQQIAREYERRGYEVIVGPTRAQLPQFFGQYQPDIWARREDDNIIVEVKTRATLASSDQLTRIADKLRDMPGWRLEFVLTNPSDRISGRGNEIGQEDARKRLREAEALAEQGQLEASVLLGWSAAESILRAVASASGVPLPNPQPNFIVKQLYSRGLLDRRQLENLNRVVDARNSIAHGFKHAPVPRKTLARFFTTIMKLGSTVG